MKTVGWETMDWPQASKLSAELLLRPYFGTVFDIVLSIWIVSRVRL